VADWPKLFLVTDEKPKARLKIPERGALSAVPGGPCPKCGHPEYLVRGVNKRIASDNQAYESDAHCTKCDALIGTLRLEMDTLFGLHEDEAVLHGRCRVY
jgi:hypothetical protein